MKEREIAVRGFMNEKFGTTFGKGLFHRAIYNGTVEVRDPYTKYLIDLFEYWKSQDLCSVGLQLHTNFLPWEHSIHVLVERHEYLRDI